VPNLRDELDVLDTERSIQDARWRLKQISWLRARLIQKNVPEKQTTDEEEAVRLERLISRKIGDELKRSSWVTALALRLHERSLPKQLMTAWQAHEETPEIVEAAKIIARQKAQEYRERSAKASKAAAEKHEAAKAEQRSQQALADAKIAKQARQAAEKAARDAQRDLEDAKRAELAPGRSRLLGIIWGRIIACTVSGADSLEGCKEAERPSPVIGTSKCRVRPCTVQDGGV
jgi:membrane protein involved in colicin uptake